MKVANYYQELSSFYATSCIPKWDTSKYKNRWEDPNYVKDLRYDMDWSN